MARCGHGESGAEIGRAGPFVFTQLADKGRDRPHSSGEAGLDIPTAEMKKLRLPGLWRVRAEPTLQSLLRPLFCRDAYAGLLGTATNRPDAPGSQQLPPTPPERPTPHVTSGSALRALPASRAGTRGARKRVLVGRRRVRMAVGPYPSGHHPASGGSHLPGRPAPRAGG